MEHWTNLLLKREVCRCGATGLPRQWDERGHGSNPYYKCQGVRIASLCMSDNRAPTMHVKKHRLHTSFVHTYETHGIL